MTQALANQTGMTALPGAIEDALIGGDLNGLSPANRVIYYNRLCESLGLNPLTKPFAYLSLNNKLTLYALKDCTDQIRNIKGVSVTEMVGKLEGDIYTVTVKGSDKSGRCDASTGAVDVKGLFGEKKANAYMKAETKAKRRLTLSLCGLGMLDESEIDSIAGARVFEHSTVTEAKPTPEVIQDKQRQENAGEEDQRPVAEQKAKPTTAPVIVEEIPAPSATPSKNEGYLKKFTEDCAQAKTKGALNDLWEAFQTRVGSDNENLGKAWKVKVDRSRAISSGVVQ